MRFQVTETPEVRFMRLVTPEPTSGCWLWTGAGRGGAPGSKLAGMYGSFRLNGRTESAHRVAWQMFRGAIPDGMMLCHHCDNPACVNPDHMYAGSASDNARDKMTRGRFGHFQKLKTHCPHGHPYSEENTERVRTPCGDGKGRHCRICKNTRRRAARRAESMTVEPEETTR